MNVGDYEKELNELSTKDLCNIKLGNISRLKILNKKRYITDTITASEIRIENQFITKILLERQRCVHG